MFNGAGFEYLYYDQDSSYAVGFEAFGVKKRIIWCDLRLLTMKILLVI